MVINGYEMTKKVPNHLLIFSFGPIFRKKTLFNQHSFLSLFLFFQAICVSAFLSIPFFNPIFLFLFFFLPIIQETVVTT